MKPKIVTIEMSFGSSPQQMDFFVLFSNPGSLVLPRNGNIDVLRLIAASGDVTELSGCFSVVVKVDDVIEIETPGGGGFGRASS